MRRRGAGVPALMFQGTGSDVGKSLLVAGLCRAYARRGLAVRPFKPQNMSNNAAVTADGGEIGRAQAVQARAAGIAPSVDMNPVLLKPQTDVGAQVVVQGRVFGNAGARDYHALKPRLLPAVMESFARLGRTADLVLAEGAGSPAEVNLRHADIANMGFAEAADLPVVLVGDIDRGGVIASLVGTHLLLEAAERARLEGYLINKFRGDRSLLDPALAVITARTGLVCHGVVRYFEAARRLPAEDAVALDNAPYPAPAEAPGPIRIAVPRLARIANFDDLDPLAAEPDVWCCCPVPRRRWPTSASCAPRAGISTSWPICGAAGGCSGCARDTRCWAGESPTRGVSKARPAPWTASACSTWRRCSAPARPCARHGAGSWPAGPRCTATRCIWA
jgi:adenosylcobyric acid synthase